MPPLPPSAALPAPAAPASSAERLRGRLMAKALGELLDRVRGSRHVLMHLAALERGLLADGVAAIDRVPPQGLAKICSQLGSLPLDEDDPVLHDLLDRVSATLDAQRADRHDQPFDIERTVVINEISHSTFMAASRDDAPTVREPRL